MSKSFQKPTNRIKLTVSKRISKNPECVDLHPQVAGSIATNHFAGMSNSLEVIQPVIIPGYKTRG